MTGVLAVLDAVVNTLWQAVAVTALVWAVLKFTPRVNAATRHAIWWATLAVVLMLPATPALVSMLRGRSHVADIKAAPATSTVSPQSRQVEPFVITIEPKRDAEWPAAIFVVWAAILLWRMGQIVRSYFYLRGVKRRAKVSNLPRPEIFRRSDLLISRDIASPMAAGFLHPAIVLPESWMEELSEQDREHVLLHESAHLARYDDWTNLLVRLLGGALALHPVAIWILRRIEREREMICDDWVVARTGAARPYAASLAHLFEMRNARREQMLSEGLFGSGSSLGERIERLVRRGASFSARASSGGVVASAAVLCSLLLGASLAPRWIAFAQQPRPVFEVASIKPNKTIEREYYGLTGSRILGKNMPVKGWIQIAYSVKDFQIAGPDWISHERFDIEAKADSQPVSPRQMMLMLQSLLADRFKLAFHKELRQSPAYALVISHKGLKMRRSEDQTLWAGDFPDGPPKGQPVTGGGPREFGPGRLTGEAIPITEFVNLLSSPLDRQVINRTGLTGRFDIDLRYAPGSGKASLTDDDQAPQDSSAPTLFTAVQQQLGLKLESTKAPIDILVIDRVERPDAN